MYTCCLLFSYYSINTLPFLRTAIHTYLMLLIANFGTNTVGTGYYIMLVWQHDGIYGSDVIDDSSFMMMMW